MEAFLEPLSKTDGIFHLHGQWDWDNPNGSDGCEGSSCLRSHVNETETAIAFSDFGPVNLHVGPWQEGSAIPKDLP
jgi:hypothetical protein